MSTKLYDTALDAISIPPEQYAHLRYRYESLRKTELYRAGRAKRTFDFKECLGRLETVLSSMTTNVRGLKLNVNFPWEVETDGAVRWREYGTTILRLYQAFAKRKLSLDLTINPRHDDKSLGYSISTEMPCGGNAIEDFKARLGLLLLPESVNRALDPITVSLETSSGRPEEFLLNKTQARDFIVLDDIRLAYAYYRQVADQVLTEIAGRGLTTYCAVDRGDGESIIRRNHSNPERSY